MISRRGLLTAQPVPSLANIRTLGVTLSVTALLSLFLPPSSASFLDSQKDHQGPRSNHTLLETASHTPLLLTRHDAGRQRPLCRHPRRPRAARCFDLHVNLLSASAQLCFVFVLLLVQVETALYAQCSSKTPHRSYGLGRQSQLGSSCHPSPFPSLFRQPCSHVKLPADAC